MLEVAHYADHAAEMARLDLLAGYQPPMDVGFLADDAFRFAFRHEADILRYAEVYEAIDDSNGRLNYHQGTREHILRVRHRSSWGNRLTTVLLRVLDTTNVLYNTLGMQVSVEELRAAVEATQRAWITLRAFQEIMRVHVTLSQVFHDEMDQVTDRNGAEEPNNGPVVDWGDDRHHDIDDDTKERLRARARENMRGEVGTKEAEYDRQWTTAVWFGNARFDKLAEAADVVLA